METRAVTVGRGVSALEGEVEEAVEARTVSLDIETRAASATRMRRALYRSFQRVLIWFRLCQPPELHWRVMKDTEEAGTSLSPWFRLCQPPELHWVMP